MNFSSWAAEGLHSKTFSRSHIAWTSSSAAHRASRFAVPLCADDAAAAAAAFPWRESLDICGVGSAMVEIVQWQWQSHPVSSQLRAN